MSKTRDPINGITEGVIWKQLLLFFFPIVLGTFFQQLYNTADAIIVGKFVGKEALAAVGGTTGTLINLLVGFFVGVSSGASVIISQFYGARKGEEVSRSVHTTVMLAILSGAGGGRCVPHRKRADSERLAQKQHDCTGKKECALLLPASPCACQQQGNANKNASMRRNGGMGRQINAAQKKDGRSHQPAPDGKNQQPFLMPFHAAPPHPV